MPARGPLVRTIVVVAAVLGGALALAGGLALRGAGLTAVAVAGLFAACLCAAIAHEEHDGNLRSSLAAAAQGAAWTVAVLLAVAGTAGLAGGVVVAPALALPGLAFVAVTVLTLGAPTPRELYGRRGATATVPAA